MLERFCPTYCIGLSQDALTLVAPGHQARVLAELPLDGTAAQLGSAWQTLLDKVPRKRARLAIVLSSDWTRIWRVTPPQGAQSLSDLAAATALRFQTLYGESARDWAIRADYDHRKAFFAAAIPQWLHTLLHSEAQKRGMAVVRLAPQFLLAWNQRCQGLPEGYWFALVHDGVCTLGAVADAALVAVCASPVPAEADAHWLSHFAQREALRLGLPTPQHIARQERPGPAGTALALTGMRP